MANVVGSHLMTLGVGAESFVGIAIHGDCIEAIVAILGVLKAGGAYVQLDPDTPSQRLRQLVADASLCIVLVRDSAAMAGAAVWIESSNALVVSVDSIFTSQQVVTGGDTKATI